MAQRRSREEKSLSVQGTQYKISLPYDQRGELEWNTLGDILTAHMLEEVQSASFADRKHGQLEKDLKATTDWEFAYEKHNVVVLKKRVKGSPMTCFAGRGVIDAPLPEVAAFLKKVENNMTWDKFLVDAQYLRTLSESDHHTDYIGYQHFETNQCFVKSRRDMLYYVRCIFKDGKYIQGALSVEDPEFLPPHGVTRVEVFLGSGFVLESYQGNKSRTMVTYIAHTDLKGLPLFIMNQVLKRHPLAIHYLRRQLMPSYPSSRNTEDTQLTQSSPVRFDTELETSGDLHWSNPGLVQFEEAMPVSHFMTDRSHSGPAPSLPTLLYPVTQTDDTNV